MLRTRIAGLQTCYFCVDKLTYLVNIISKGGEKMPDYVALIANVGFPIAACISMGWFVVKQMGAIKAEIKEMRKAYAEDHDKVVEALCNNTIAMNELSNAIKSKEGCN